MNSEKRITIDNIESIVVIVCTPLSLVWQGMSKSTVAVVMILLVLAFLLWRNNKLKQNLAQQNKMLENTKALGYPIATLQYLTEQKERKAFNTYRIDQVSVKYTFDVCIKGRYVHQRVEYRFKGNNYGKKAVTSHTMTVAKSVFSEFDKVQITAKDHIRGCDLDVERPDRKQNLQWISVLFKETGIERNEDFDFSIFLDWKDPQRVDAYRYLIIDPKNYSKNVGKLIIEMETDEISFDWATKKLLEVDRNTMDYEAVRNLSMTLNDKERHYLKNSIEPRKGCIYLLQMRMQPIKDRTKVE